MKLAGYLYNIDVSVNPHQNSCWGCNPLEVYWAGAANLAQAPRDKYLSYVFKSITPGIYFCIFITGNYYRARYVWKEEANEERVEKGIWKRYGGIDRCI
jgi:hypothetical protein